MGKVTGIDWCDSTWNPLRGCSHASAGCDNCYAERIAGRFSGAGMAYEGLAEMVNGKAHWTGKVQLVVKHLLDPLKWGPVKVPIYSENEADIYPENETRRRRIFVNSMGDFFHPNFPDAVRDRIMAVIALCPQHDFIILTKRAPEMREYMTRNLKSQDVAMAICGLIKSGPDAVCHAANRYSDWLEEHYPGGAGFIRTWPPPNLILGVTAENQAAADKRISVLLQTPAARRGVSIEPMLGSVSVWAFLVGEIRDQSLKALASDPMPGLDWVIAGPETGPGKRPFEMDWARSLRDQCVAADVPFFWKGKEPIDGQEWKQFPKEG